MRSSAGLPIAPSASRFTLVEMLVVISIIAILAAMLMPALQEAVETAHSVTCSNNLRLLGVAFVGYTDDNHGRSLSAGANYYGSQQYNWLGYLSSFYMDSSWNTQTILPPGMRCSAGMGYTKCYGMNLYFERATRKRGLSYMKKPSQTIVFGDGGWYWNTYWQKPYWQDSFGTNRYREAYKFRHFNGGDEQEMSGYQNALFGDFHVSQTGPSREITITTPHERCRLLNPWYPDDYLNGHPGTGGRTSP